MDPDWDTDLNSRSYGIFIQTLATPRHVSNGLTKMVGPSSAGFLEHHCAAGSVLGDRPVAFGRGCCCGGLRDFVPTQTEPQLPRPY